MRPVIVGLLLLTYCSINVNATPIANPGEREGLSLNGKWPYIVDLLDSGYFSHRGAPFDVVNPPTGGFSIIPEVRNESDLFEHGFSDALTLRVPGDWNSQADELLYYEGTIWYHRTFIAPENREGKRHILYFGGASYETDVYLNGYKLGKHIGGFTPFDYEVTDRLRDGKNDIVVRVNNQRLVEGVPTLATDWWNYGGITRDVKLIEVPETYVADYSLKLLRGSTDKRIAAEVQLNGPSAAGATVQIEIPELGVQLSQTADASGKLSVEFSPENLERWSPENPRLYQVFISGGGDRTQDKVGFRTIETRGRQILLNGEPIFLRGISIHEENPLRGGRAVTREDARLLLEWAQELGCNFARLAHYPHSEYMARLADEMGILLWEEIPVYWTIAWENPDTLENAKTQLTELIERDKNRASVIIWSVANETPPSEARTLFLKTLVDQARALDNTRLVSAALEVDHHPDYPDHSVVADPFGAFVDVVSFNQYYGWYSRDILPDGLDKLQWKVLFDKPVIISEWGGGALAGLRGPRTQRFTEDFQAWLYEETLPMLERIEGLAGMSPWVLADFRSPRRLLPGIQDGWNLKGVIGQNGERKLAFEVLKAYYESKAAESQE